MAWFTPKITNKERTNSVLTDEAIKQSLAIIENELVRRWWSKLSSIIITRDELRSILKFYLSPKLLNALCLDLLETQLASQYNWLVTCPIDNEQEWYNTISSAIRIFAIDIINLLEWPSTSEFRSQTLRWHSSIAREALWNYVLPNRDRTYWSSATLQQRVYWNRDTIFKSLELFKEKLKNLFYNNYFIEFSSFRNFDCGQENLMQMFPGFEDIVQMSNLIEYLHASILKELASLRSDFVFLSDASKAIENVFRKNVPAW